MGSRLCWHKKQRTYQQRHIMKARLLMKLLIVSILVLCLNFIFVSLDIITRYETTLKKLNPDIPQIQYEVNDLLKFIDYMQDICCLVYDAKNVCFYPRDKDWLKEKILSKLQRV